MDLQELSQNIKAIRDEAKYRWGEQTTANPYTIPKSERGDSFTGNVFEVVVNEGWQYHINQLFLSDDPETYLLEHPGVEK